MTANMSDDNEWEYGYGYFPGGDPRLFSPDAESCTDAEIEAHRLACDAWDRGDQVCVPPNHIPIVSGADVGKALASGADAVVLYPDGSGHVTRATFGVGSYRLRRDVPA